MKNFDFGDNFGDILKKYSNDFPHEQIPYDKVIIPILIGAAAFAYYQIDMSKKM